MGVRLALVEPRIAAVGLFAGSVIPRATMAEARAVTVPVHVLLQWDDEGNDRQAALELFDGLGSREKTLVANVGGHTGVPTSAGDDAAHFFRRHLTRIPADDAATPVRRHALCQPGGGFATAFRDPRRDSQQHQRHANCQ